MKKIRDDCPIMVSEVPELIMEEIGVWIEECKKIKDHPYSELRYSNTKGLEPDNLINNLFRVHIPSHLIERSFFFPWILRVCSKNFGNNFHTDFRLRTNPGHFYGYDMWANITYSGNEFKTHDHSGDLSGVIYVKNHNHPTWFDDYDISYNGTDGTMVLFPSDVFHHVKEQLSNEERITISFNIIKLSAGLKNRSEFLYQ